jgi:adenylylsulfate reductase subunit B
MWTIKFRNGMLKRFKFPIRTTEEGKAQPSGGYGTAHDDLSGPVLSQEPEALRTPEVYTIK